MKFGTDGVRGVAHEELTTEFAARLARAASRVLGADGCSTVVIGGDTRESTPAFADVLADSFAASGIDVVRMGVASTPAVAFEAQRRNAMGAVVSASHNPWQDNGIKLFAPGGTKLPDDVEAKIEQVIDERLVASATPSARSRWTDRSRPTANTCSRPSKADDSTGCAWCSTLPTAPRSTSPPTSCGRQAPR